jgi:hypothetical protein
MFACSQKLVIGNYIFTIISFIAYIGGTHYVFHTGKLLICNQHYELVLVDHVPVLMFMYFAFPQKDYLKKSFHHGTFS